MNEIYNKIRNVFLVCFNVFQLLVGIGAIWFLDIRFKLLGVVLVLWALLKEEKLENEFKKTHKLGGN